MKLGSLFDGSGTCPLAASAVGIIPAWASEIEPFPKAVTQSRFPKMVHLGDITKMNGAEIEPVDVITFGSPCQNLSIAGNGKGLAGQESSLFFEAIRVIQEMRCATNGRFPQIVIWENVYGAFSSTQGEDFRTVIETLWKICEGNDSVPRYAEDKQGRQKWPHTGFVLGDHSSIAWRGLDAQGWGVPQRRKRVFVVLDLGGQCAGRILFEREGLRRDFKKVRRTGEEVSPTLKAGASGLQAPVVAIPHKFPIVCRATQQSNAETMIDCCPTITSAAGTSGNNQPIAAIPYTLKIRSGCEGGGKGALVQKDKSATLSCNNDPTLFVPLQTENGEVIYLARKLTPTECASLQGFEKDWCALVPHKDSAEYKMWGNGMAFPCMLYIMEGVQEVLAERYLDNLFGGDTAEP